jgi:hypothetical protein
MTGSSTAACVPKSLRLNRLIFPNQDFASAVIAKPSNQRRAMSDAPQSKSRPGASHRAAC